MFHNFNNLYLNSEKILQTFSDKEILIVNHTEIYGTISYSVYPRLKERWSIDLPTSRGSISVNIQLDDPKLAHRILTAMAPVTLMTTPVVCGQLVVGHASRISSPSSNPATKCGSSPTVSTLSSSEGTKSKIKPSFVEPPKSNLSMKSIYQRYTIIQIIRILFSFCSMSSRKFLWRITFNLLNCLVTPTGWSQPPVCKQVCGG